MILAAILAYSCTGDENWSGNPPCVKVSVIQANNAPPVSGGTGFFINSPTESSDALYLVTAKHVIGKYSGAIFSSFGSNILCYAVDREGRVSEFVNFPIDKYTLGHRLIASREHDIALLYIERGDPLTGELYELVSKKGIRVFSPLSCVQNISLSEESEIRVAGFPQNSFGQKLNSDFFLRESAVNDFTVDPSSNSLLFKSHISGGMSGGPIFTMKDDNWRLLGLVTHQRYRNRVPYSDSVLQRGVDFGVVLKLINESERERSISSET